MKKITAILVCISVLFLSGCTAIQKTDKKVIAVSFYPVYIFTLNLTDGIEEVEVRCVAEQNTGCLHDYTVTAKDAKLLNDCHAFVINGAGMEGFVEDLYTTVDNLLVIDSSSGIETMCSNSEHNEENHHDHEHSHSENSHIWMSVENAIRQVENISQGLVEVLPEYENQINKNKADYVSRLKELLSESEEVKSYVQGKYVVSFHDSYDYLAEDLGFNVLTTVESDEGSAPSAKELAHLADEIKEKNVTALLIEPQYDGSAAEILQNETDAQIYILNPVTSGGNVKTAYEDIMRENYKVLKAVK